MKVSFSTLGCPRWTWNEVFSTAKDLGVQGVEIRGLGSAMYAPEIKEFSEAECENTKEKLSKLNIEIPIFTTGAALADREKGNKSFVEACDYINCASRMGVKYIRIMGTDKPEITDGDFDRCVELYNLVCEYGKIQGVTPLLETNGKLSNSDFMLEILNRVKSDNKGVLWDVHHTVRFADEAPLKTVNTLGNYIKHIHVKDSVVEDGSVIYKMMGYGDLPVGEALRELKKTGYDGFVSLEWVKRWQPYLQEPGIVFAGFANYMADIMEEL